MLTHVMDTPLIGILACFLVLEQGLQKILTKCGVGVKEEWPANSELAL